MKYFYFYVPLRVEPWSDSPHMGHAIDDNGTVICTGRIDHLNALTIAANAMPKMIEKLEYAQRMYRKTHAGSIEELKTKETPYCALLREAAEAQGKE